MSPVLYVAAVLAVAPLAIGLYWTVARSGRTPAIARRNLTRGLFTPVLEVGSLEARRTGAGAILRTLTPDGTAARVRRLLLQAGLLGRNSMSRVLWTKIVLAVGVLVIGVPVVLAAPGLLPVLVLALLVLGSYHLPEAILWNRGRERQELIERALPDVLDQMTVAVEAGLGFESALSRAASSGRGPLADELTRTLQDVAVGRPRREAYETLVRRVDVTDLRRFVGAINQADTYGIAVADVLRAQAADLRDKRKQRAEAKALQIPVKVTFPLMVCILPALLLVVVGPSVIDLLGVLG